MVCHPPAVQWNLNAAVSNERINCVAQLRDCTPAVHVHYDFHNCVHAVIAPNQQALCQTYEAQSHDKSAVHRLSTDLSCGALKNGDAPLCARINSRTRSRCLTPRRSSCMRCASSPLQEDGKVRMGRRGRPAQRKTMRETLCHQLDTLALWR
jgi:hypothetical protein